MKISDSGNKDFDPAPQGTHIARCYQVIDLGTQTGSYQGKETHSRKLFVNFELPTELMADGERAGKPFSIAGFWTASLSEKANLRGILESWRGVPFTPEELMGFDIAKVLGKPCMVTILHSDKGKAYVSAVTSMPKGVQCPPQVNESLYLSLEEFQASAFEKVSKGLQDMIKKSPEYAALFTNGSKPPVPSIHDMESDIPF